MKHRGPLSEEICPTRGVEPISEEARGGVQLTQIGLEVDVWLGTRPRPNCSASSGVEGLPRGKMLDDGNVNVARRVKT